MVHLWGFSACLLRCRLSPSVFPKFLPQTRQSIAEKKQESTVIVFLHSLSTKSFTERQYTRLREIGSGRDSGGGVSWGKGRSTGVGHSRDDQIR